MTDKESIKKYLKDYFPLDNVEHVVEEIEGKICINGLCPLAIKIGSHVDKSVPIKVINEQSDELGTIYFVEKNSTVEISSLPEIYFYCFLIDIPSETIPEKNYRFLYDYILIHKETLKEYVDDYKKKSPIWGGYFHVEDLPNNTFLKTKSYTEITAYKNIKIDRNFYLDTLELILVEPNPFNRFLKLYHLIEMQFDMHTAEKINTLLTLGNKEQEISRTLKDYNREDIERLKSLFTLRLDNFRFISLLDNVINYKPIADSLFYDYGKDSNPIKSKKQFDAIVSLGSFNEANINSVLGNNIFNIIIPKIIAYWIYRIRSSIAHNKLGEYLMSVNDEEFIIEFAEPLIREVIIQCYKS